MTVRATAAVLFLVLTTGACANAGVYMPASPGGGASDLSGPNERELWLAENPDTPDDIQAAIREGVFLPGMTVEHRDVISNGDRRGTTGYGYWRVRELGDETRYQWFVAGRREPFDDGRGRAVCELVFASDVLVDTRFCSDTSTGTKDDE